LKSKKNSDWSTAFNQKVNTIISARSAHTAWVVAVTFDSIWDLVIIIPYPELAIVWQCNYFSTTIESDTFSLVLSLTTR